MRVPSLRPTTVPPERVSCLSQTRNPSNLLTRSSTKLAARAARILAATQTSLGGSARGNSMKGGKPAAASSFPQIETPSAEDMEKGNYVIEGWRHLLVKNPGKAGYHAYTKIPVIENGRVKRDSETRERMHERWGVLGKNNSSENQQVRDDPRNDQIKGYEGKEVYVKVTPEQREALRQGMQYFSANDGKENFTHPCPVCGSRYRRFSNNSNTFQYNMRFWNPEGPMPSVRAPVTILAPGDYKNEPNEQWYQPKKPSGY